MISADVKADVKQRIKELVIVSYLKNCSKKYLQNSKCILKKACIFHLILVGIPSSWMLPLRKREVRGGGAY